MADMAVDLETAERSSACFPVSAGERGTVIEVSRRVAKVRFDGHRRDVLLPFEHLISRGGAVGPVGPLDE